jgi:hypothetical protein
LKCKLISPMRFCLGISDTYILCFNQIKPPLLTLSLSPCFSVIQQLTVHCIVLSSYTDAMF